jgi:hypothetical protein
MLDPSLQGFLWVAAIALTVIVLDVFFETEFLSHAALLGISVYFGLLFDVDTKWRLLIGLACWLGVTAMFYLLWKQIAVPLIRRGFTRGIEESIHSAVGASGEFRIIDGKCFVQWNGDLWPVDLEGEGTGSAEADIGELKDRETVTIAGVANGVFSIRQRPAKIQ